jgi:hypothetical protein
VGQRNLKLLGGQGMTDGRTDGQADSSIPLTTLLCGGINMIMPTSKKWGYIDLHLSVGRSVGRSVSP